MKRAVTGVLLIDKPAGMTSQQVVSKVKWLLKSDHHDSKKAGHTGTLDPMATGLLPICLGEATKFAGFGLSADKAYLASVLLGASTDTGDKEGQITQTADVPAVSQAKLEEIALSMTGEIAQIPPMVSALKKEGKKLYEYARAGVEIERSPRNVLIHKLHLEKTSENTLDLAVTCSKGTYVRVLGEDIAKKLGTLGYLTALRRTQTGGFDVADAITLAAFEALPFEARLACLLSPEVLLGRLPSVVVDGGQAERLRLGQRLNLHAHARRLDVKEPVLVRLYADGQFLGMGELSCEGRLQPKKILTYEENET
ncbi:MAG: tRNA pseudouridine(55) synthase TruB [Moraxella sp.]|nr:tRNA pseudouridine(55) synthase TruB [Moraxella sp.]